MALVDGKGLNIARVFSGVFRLSDYFCINILGGHVGEIIEKECINLGITTENFWIEDSNRINTALVYEYENRTLMINEPGPFMSSQEIRRFIEFFERKIGSHMNLVISGSAPRGFGVREMTELVEIAVAKKCSLRVDIAGCWLPKIAEFSPGILKVNADELRAAFGLEKGDLKSMERFRVKHEIDDLIITDGPQGSVWLSETEKLQAFSTRIYSDFSVGSGDAFFAGLLYGNEKLSSKQEALKIATACGAANTLCYGASVFELSDLNRTIGDVVIRSLDL